MNINKFHEYYKINSIKKIHTGSVWTEGPCYLKKKNKLIWSDIPNNRLLSYDFKKVEIFRFPSNFSNGNTLDNLGNLITCEHGARRLTKTNENNVISLICDEYKTKRLNSPNDVCVHSNNTIFFTDPPYGILDHGSGRVEGFPGKQMYGGSYVFKYDSLSKKINPIITDMDRPNGIAFSLDEKKIYISNSGQTKYIRVYDVDEDLEIKNKRVFAESDINNVFDGLRIDAEDNVWASCGKAIKCFDKNSNYLGKIDFPEVVSNLEFAGKDGDILFVTATSSLYMVNLNVSGAKFKKKN